MGARWLHSWCCQVAHAPASDDTISTAVARVLLMNRSGDEMAAELFDMLGDGAIDAIQQLLSSRSALPTLC